MRWFREDLDNKKENEESEKRLSDVSLMTMCSCATQEKRTETLCATVQRHETQGAEKGAQRDYLPEGMNDSSLDPS